MIGRVARGLVALAIGSLGLVGMAATAHAGSGSIDSPLEGARVNKGPTITGKVTLARPMESLTLQLASTLKGGPPGMQGQCGTDPGDVICHDDGTFSWSPTVPYNGPYVVTGQATSAPAQVTGERDTASIEARHFGLEIAPAALKRVVVSVDDATRKVTLTWAQSPEPDAAYLVFRKEGNGQSERLAALTRDTTKFVDDDPGPGGENTYQLQAVRPDADDDTSTGVASDPVSRSVLVPSGTTASTTPGGASGGSSGTAGGSSGGSGGGSAIGIPRAGRVDLSGFASLEAAAGGRPAAPAPDPGFKQDLPYGPGTTAAPAAAAPPDESALPGAQATVDTPEDNQRALLSFVAGAMLLFMLSMHLRWLLRRATPTDLV